MADTRSPDAEHSHQSFASRDACPECRAAMAAAALATRSPDAVEAAHPEDTCERCGRPNAPTWHAPSPLWNAVLRDRATGFDAYEIVCPPCFAELAEAKGYRFGWHFGPHEDVTSLWADRDGRVWDSKRCLWVEAADSPDAVEAARALRDSVERAAHFSFLDSARADTHVQIRRPDWEDVGRRVDAVLEAALAVRSAPLDVERLATLIQMHRHLPVDEQAAHIAREYAALPPSPEPEP